jgi:hypothetical protein
MLVQERARVLFDGLVPAVSPTANGAVSAAKNFSDLVKFRRETKHHATSTKLKKNFF